MNFIIFCPVGESRTLCILIFFLFSSKSMNMLKPLLSSSRSWSVCRVVRLKDFPHFCQDHHKCSHLPPELRVWSCRFSDQLKAIKGGMDYIIINFTLLSMNFQCLRRTCFIYSRKNVGWTWYWRPGVSPWILGFSWMKHWHTQNWLRSLPWKFSVIIFAGWKFSINKFFFSTNVSIARWCFLHNKFTSVSRIALIIIDKSLQCPIL